MRTASVSVSRFGRAPSPPALLLPPRTVGGLSRNCRLLLPASCSGFASVRLSFPSCAICSRASVRKAPLGEPDGLLCRAKGHGVPWSHSCLRWAPLAGFEAIPPHPNSRFGVFESKANIRPIRMVFDPARGLVAQ